MENGIPLSSRQRKIVLLTIVFVIVVAGVCIYAWFHFHRTIYSFSQVQAPSTLAIKGPNDTTIQMIDLSNVDLTNDDYKSNFVFCVTGTSQNPYKLELAYTTNVPFTYTIYKTQQTDVEPSNTDTCVYKDLETNSTYYYPYDTTHGKFNGVYVNNGSDDSENKLALQDGENGNKHPNAYDQYSGNYVQKHAEPLYYLIKGIKPGEEHTQDGRFIDYYVLELTWPKSVATAYEKETDLVYLLVATDTSDSAGS